MNWNGLCPFWIRSWIPLYVHYWLKWDVPSLVLLLYASWWCSWIPQSCVLGTQMGNFSTCGSIEHSLSMVLLVSALLYIACNIIAFMLCTGPSSGHMDNTSLPGVPTIQHAQCLFVTLTWQWRCSLWCLLSIPLNPEWSEPKATEGYFEENEHPYSFQSC